MKRINDQQLREVQLRILDSVHDFCCQNQITYFLTSGTLLGAVRHNGYIPWDDDIDICMPRPDYNRFIQSYNEEQSMFTLLCNQNTPSFLWHCSKICDPNSIVEEQYNDFNFDYGIYIDLFPIDVYPGRLKGLWYGFLKKAIHIKISKAKRKWYKKMLLTLLNLPFLLISAEKLNQLILRYPLKQDYEKTQTVFVESYKSKMDGPLDKELFASKQYMKFEGREYVVMKGYHELLTAKYGNYMELPPEHERIPPHYICAYIK